MRTTQRRERLYIKVKSMHRVLMAAMSKKHGMLHMPRASFFIIALRVIELSRRKMMPM